MRKVVAVLIAGAALAGACASRQQAAPSVAPGEDRCAKENLALKKDGVLTIGTDKPAYPPWFQGNDPSNGKGYEGAVAREIATRLGFSPAETTFVAVPFNKSFAPGPKEFDFYITQVSITPERAQAVDFSEGYYDVAQALVALKGSAASRAKTIGDLVGEIKLGAQVGTTSLDYIDNVIQPSEDTYVYDTTNDAKSALENGQIDGIVVDLPTAFYITAVEIPNSVVVGQFPQQGGEQERFGLVLEKGSALTECVNEVIAGMRADGTLDELEQTWLAEKTNAPVLT